MSGINTVIIKKFIVIVASIYLLRPSRCYLGTICYIIATILTIIFRTIPCGQICITIFILQFIFEIRSIQLILLSNRKTFNTIFLFYSDKNYSP